MPVPKVQNSNFEYMNVYDYETINVNSMEKYISTLPLNYLRTISIFISITQRSQSPSSMNATL